MKTSRFFCEYCGSEVPLSAEFCAACGKKFSAVKCPKCLFSGKPALFSNGCPKCGYLSRTPISNRMPRRKAHEKQPFPPAVYGILGFILFGLLVLLLYLILKQA